MLNAGFSISMADMAMGMRLHNSVMEGTVSENIWYDLMLFSNVACFLSARIVVYQSATACAIFHMQSEIPWITPYFMLSSLNFCNSHRCLK
jgi:hypothetical protein